MPKPRGANQDAGTARRSGTLGDTGMTSYPSSVDPPTRAGAEMSGLQTRTPFVGRETELATLLAGLDRAASGRGGLILLGGEPGIGKSRLADELAAVARTRGFVVLWGRAWEDPGAPPYWPWVQVLRSYLRQTDADTVRRQHGQGASDIVQVLPEVRELVPDLAPVAGES